MQSNRYKAGPVATFVAGLLSVVALGLFVASIMAWQENPTEGVALMGAFIGLGWLAQKIGGD